MKHGGLRILRVLFVGPLWFSPDRILPAKGHCIVEIVCTRTSGGWCEVVKESDRVVAKSSSSSGNGGSSSSWEVLLIVVAGSSERE